MVEIEFIYKTNKATIQCQENEILKEIIKRYSIKIMKNVDKLFFLYNGIKINEEYSFKELANNLDKENRKMSILVNDIESESSENNNNNNIKKSKDIICPNCKGNIRIKFDNYKIKLYGCEKDHIYEDIQLNEFYKLQNIDESQIICDNCKKNKSETFNNQFYICNTCNLKLCPMCKSKHEYSHYIIDYELKNYFCKLHNCQKYTSYCKTCKLNICFSCSEKHDEHEVIYYQKIIPKKEEKIKEMEKLRSKLDDMTIIINNMINVCNKVIENIEIYYNIEMDILNKYNINNLNYEILQNINDININISQLNEDIDKLINNDNLYNNKIYEIYQQMIYKNILKDNKKDLKKDEIIEDGVNNNDEIIYKINKNEKKVKIFGEKFVKNNSDKIEILYKNKTIKLTEELKIEDEEDNNLNYRLIKIKLKGINNVTNMSYMFDGCSSLSSLPDISKWNNSNVADMHCMFCGCSSLSSLPDISKWNTNNVKDMSKMFYGCSSLSSLPDISKWNTNNVNNMYSMFSGCSSLSSLPDISKWNTKNVAYMTYMLYGCSSLSSLPEISQWNIKNLKHHEQMFEGCSSSLKIPNKFKDCLIF